MKFVLGSKEKAVLAICERIGSGLQMGQRVLWLTSGGSNTLLEVDIMRKLRDYGDATLQRLTILPMDERYGKPGFADSNTQQLCDAGFEPGTADWTDILAKNLPFLGTVEYYSDSIGTALQAAQLVVGQFGMGADAHIAGIKPDSPATVPGSATVIGYEWDDYARMTMTAEALKRIDVAYVVAYGADKLPAFERLRDDTETFDELPAKLFYELPEVYVYNDQIGNKE